MDFKKNYNFHSKFNEEVYPYFGNNTEQVNFAISGISYTDKSYYIDRYPNSSYYSIEYILEGEGTVIENDTEYKVSKGDFFILHPGKGQIYYTSKTNPWQKIFITTYYDTYLINTLLHQYNIDDVTVFPKINSPLSLEKIYELIKNNDSGVGFELECLLSKLIIELAHRLSKHNSECSAIDKAKNIISKNIDKKISVTELCKSLNISQSYFRTIFKKETGVSPNRYIIEQKIKQSKILLSHSDTPIDDIAYALSFNDTPYYTRVFKKVTGTTPAEYRKKYSGSQYDWSY